MSAPLPPAALLRLLALLGPACAPEPGDGEGVTARYVRVENPTGFVMEFRQIEVFSGGKNVVRGRREAVSGTVPPRPGDDRPTPESIVVQAPREGEAITNGDTDTSRRAPEWRAWVDPGSNAHGLNPWFEIDLGKPMPVERVVLYASRYPSRLYLDKGHRVVSLLDGDRRVVWAEKWPYYDQARFPKGVFSFVPVAGKAGGGSVIGVRVPPRAPDWVSMGWLLEAESSAPPPDAARRRAAFAARDAPAEVARLADRFFLRLDDRLPEIAAAKQLHRAGRPLEALEAWKAYWFAKMARVNLHAALRGDFVTYGAHGQDLLNGLMVSITPSTARAIRYEPGCIHWIDLPAGGDPRALNAAIEDGKAKAAVGKVSWPLLHAYRKTGDPAYLRRWAEIMDDWSIHFFEDAGKVPWEVEDLFTFHPCHAWGAMMEDLSDIARERPALARLVPATTLARVQLVCLEKYSTAWWRQARETVFNHVTGGLYAWDAVLPYVDEFHPGQRARREWRQAFERFMTLGTERDGSLTEIGDEGHQEIPVLLGFNLQRAENDRPAWYTPGWRNRALEWYDNLFYYMFRHLAPGGYEHRFAVDYRPYRWETTVRPYFQYHPQAPPLINRDAAVFGHPEVRRLLDAWGHISSGLPPVTDPVFKPIAEARQRSREIVRRVLGDEKPGPPRVVSDWMPYTGAYYFRGSWEDDAPFLAMMACGSHGGSQAPQWPYGMWYHYDYGYPLVAARPVLVDGQPPDHLQGRRHTFQPGTKTMALTNADEKPAPHRWLSTKRFDFGEARFRGTYHDFPGFRKNWDHTLEIVLDDGRGVPGVDSLRQVLQARESRLFVVVDALRVGDGRPRLLSVPYTFSLSARQKDPGRPAGPRPLQVDEKAGRIRSDNPDGPSVTLHLFSDPPLSLREGPEAKVDTRKYARRLTEAVGIAEQPVRAEAKGDRLTLVSVIASRDRGAPERLAAIEGTAGGGQAGFHARLADGGEIWCRSAGLGTGRLSCGPAAAEGQLLLAIRGRNGVSGLLLGGTSLSLDGKPVPLREADCEFVAAGGAVATTPILRPIDPVRFTPARGTFTGAETVAMISDTPGVEIRYTDDGTPPGRASKRYTGPITITATTEFAARAYRLGPDGKPMEAEDFEINGTKFTVPSYAAFVRRPLQPALSLSPDRLEPGLTFERLEAPWWTLYASAHWLPAAETGRADREMEGLREPGPEPYGMRYRGYLRVPEDGVYTFHAPRELVFMDYATSYDLRVYVDGEEWDLAQGWHAHGTWSIPLQKGFHAFQVDFADARTNPWRKSGIWRYYPRPWAIYPGKPGDLLVSGAGLDRARIPREWLFRPRTDPR